ncbi:hypothetical protein M0R88_07335 [Halorussus gelatinilyticus]|uniref:Uncharacterized protein n=1 Tax=Halorussus gelatinilyticus TaxID=2937524 RepID=A0A8U0IL98_9EURY|nr:hypothetical protein [Halorussus gelatinilyticus]UPW01900.1 hypothetical protein M0R88_07335 [Halorussus gelatinilyticus]
MGETTDGDSSDEYTFPQLSNGLGSVLKNPFEWFFLLENRVVIAGMILVAFLMFFLAIELLIGMAHEQMVPLFYIFSSLIGGNLTLITIVLSINQLVISQHLNSPGGLREEIQGVNEYRNSVEETLTREVAPVTPSDFLEMLLESTQQCVESADEQTDEITDPDAAEALSDLLDDTIRTIEHSRRVLERSDVGLFNALSVTLKTNYSQEIYRVRDLQTTHEELLTEDIDDHLDELVVRIQQMDVARQYFKTLYLQDELAYLSRVLLYVGVPAELTALTMLLVFAASTQPILAPSTLAVVVPVAICITAAPLAILFAFVIRVSVVAQRTAAITPFTTSSQE